MAEEQFAPHNKAADANEPTFDGERVRLLPEVRAALDAFAATGLLAAGMDEAVGGMQLPAVVSAACFAWFQAANVSTSAYPFLTLASANLLLAHGSPEQVATYVEPMVAKRFFGTMCLSEPQAGSALADIAMRAEPQEDGTYACSAARCGSPAATTTSRRTSSTSSSPGSPAGLPVCGASASSARPRRPAGARRGARRPAGRRPRPDV